MSELVGKKVLVTGGTGFLGSALAQRLAKEGAQVRVLARRPERDRLLQGVAGIERVAGDLSQPESLKTVVQDCDIVFHVAVSYGTLDDQMRVNRDGTRALAQQCADAHVKRFVHISSLAAYGYQVRGNVTENTPLKPSIEPYSTSKAAAETVLIETAERQYMSYTIIRPGGIFGANSNMWTKTMFSLAKRKPLIFIGDGSGHAPLIHVDDLVNLIVMCATHPNAHNQAFNAVYPQAHTWREFLGEYAKLVNNTSWFGLPIPLLQGIARLIALFSNRQQGTIALPELLDYALSNVTYSTEKAQNLVGWQTEVSLQDGVQRCIPYLREKGLLA